MSTSVIDATSIVLELPAPPFEIERQAKHLPAEPVIKVRPPRFWETIDLRELWAHREVLYFLIWRDLKVRYKQTILGAAWVVLQPMLITVVFNFSWQAYARSAVSDICLRCPNALD